MATRWSLRIRLATLALLLIAMVLIARLYQLQILNGSLYAARADAQFVEPLSPLLDRASIFFTDKEGREITAATLRDGFSLTLSPPQVEDADALFEALHDDPIVQGTDPDCGLRGCHSVLHSKLLGLCGLPDTKAAVDEAVALGG